MDIKKYYNMTKEELLRAIEYAENEICEAREEINMLRKERDFFKALMNEIPDTIYFKDTNSKFTRINKAQQKLLGIEKPSEAIGKSDFDFFEHKHAIVAFNDEKEIMRSGKPQISKEESFTTISGEKRWVAATKVPIYDKQGNVLGIVGISRDITDKKRNEQKIIDYTKELQILNASKDKFFSILAHDLKNPFIALLGSTEILINQKNEITDNERDELINNIASSCNHTYQLLENLLEWSRAQTGRIDFCPKSFDVEIAISESIKLLSEVASKKCISLIKKCDKNLCVYADANMIETVIRNLITNAIKFSNTDSEIVIAAHRNDEHHIQIEIIDNGVGISEKNIQKLFDISVNHTTSGTHNEKGTGLGLILCKEFVEKNGGKIWVESTLDKGSKFSFIVPSDK